MKEPPPGALGSPDLDRNAHAIVVENLENGSTMDFYSPLAMRLLWPVLRPSQGVNPTKTPFYLYTLKPWSANSKGIPGHCFCFD